MQTNVIGICIYDCALWRSTPGDATRLEYFISFYNQSAQGKGRI